MNTGMDVGSDDTKMNQRKQLPFGMAGIPVILLQSLLIWILQPSHWVMDEVFVFPAIVPATLPLGETLLEASAMRLRCRLSYSFVALKPLLSVRELGSYKSGL